jgi:hypothetical protein
VLRIRIWDPVPFLPLDPGSGMGKNQDPDPGSGMYLPDHISESLETIFWVKILKFFDTDADPDPGIFLTLDPGWKNSDPGSAILSVIAGTYKSMVVVILILPLYNIMSASTRSPAQQRKTVVPCSCLSRFLEAERDSVNPLMSAICCIFCLRFSFSLARRSGRCSSHS